MAREALARHRLSGVHHLSSSSTAWSVKQPVSLARFNTASPMEEGMPTSTPGDDWRGAPPPPAEKVEKRAVVMARSGEAR